MTRSPARLKTLAADPDTIGVVVDPGRGGDLQSGTKRSRIWTVRTDRGAVAMSLAFSDDGPGPLVVLLHGFPLSREMWAPQLTTIGARYRVIAPDFPGFGKTPPGEAVSTMDGLATRVLDLLDDLGIRERVVIGGLSMGGYVAQAIALSAPERVRGLMLICTRAIGDTADQAQDRKALADRVEAAGSGQEALDAVLPKLFGPATTERRPELIAQMAKLAGAASPRGIAAALRGMAARPDRTASLASIAVPTLVLAGADDQLIPVEEARAMAEALPDAQLVVVPGVGHLAPLEEPKASNAAIEAFLDGLE